MAGWGNSAGLLRGLNGWGQKSIIDKQRIAAVRKLEQLGYTFAAGAAPAITDALHALLVKRADDLEGCSEGSDEGRELEVITDTIEAYDVVRWPSGKVNGGKRLI